MIDSRDIEELEPDTRRLCKLLIKRCEERGIRLLVTSTYRSWACQDALYAKGRTAPGAKVTNARGGQSWHNFRRAFDVVPLDSDGRCVWNDSNLWLRIGRLGQALKLEWGGDFKTLKDKPHFQFTEGMTLADARERIGKDCPKTGTAIA